MANRGSRKKIPLTIKEVSIVARILLYVVTALVIILCIISATYSIHKVGLLKTNVSIDYLEANMDYDTMYMPGVYFDTEGLTSLIESNPNEYIKFTALVYAKYAIQLAAIAVILCATILFLDFDNLKNPFTKKNTKLIDTIIGSTMFMFFANVIINLIIRYNCPNFINHVSTLIFPIIYCLITCGLLIFNYCLRTGMNMLKEEK